MDILKLLEIVDLYCPKGDEDEYARIMKKFINKEIDYFKISEKCINNWKKTCTPDIVGNIQLGIYKELKKS